MSLDVWITHLCLVRVICVGGNLIYNYINLYYFTCVRNPDENWMRVVCSQNMWNVRQYSVAYFSQISSYYVRIPRCDGVLQKEVYLMQTKLLQLNFPWKRALLKSQSHLAVFRNIYSVDFRYLKSHKSCLFSFYLYDPAIATLSSNFQLNILSDWDWVNGASSVYCRLLQSM